MKSSTQRERAREVLAKEAGYIRKPHGDRLRVALAFPNTYWVGMSNLGFQTVYRLFNAHEDVVCERVFLPPKQELAELLASGARLVTLESRNCLVLADEPAWATWLRETRAFLEQPSGAGTPFEELSPRECDLALLISEGLDNAQIAARLAISEKTVRNHVTRIFAKLGVETRAQAIVLAHRMRFGRTVEP